MSDKLKGFSGHEFSEISEILKSIVTCPLPAEVFDAFLAEYKRSGDLERARYYAMCEWDC